MQKVLIAIAMLAIAIGLIVGVIIPITSNAHSTGQNAKNNMEAVDTQVTGVSTPVN